MRFLIPTEKTLYAADSDEKIADKEAILTLLEAIICGIIQGITEFLPVSSSGHLAIIHRFFGMETSESSLTFDLLLHLATLIVVFVVYYKEIFSLVPAFFTMLGKVFRGKWKLAEYTKNERFVILIILATLPLAAAFFVKDAVEMVAGYTRAVGMILVLNGIMLLLCDHFAGHGKRDELTPGGALGVGIFQMCAILPGLSRSGSTISGGLIFGLDRADAVKFSFILSVPAILGANIFNVPDALATKVSGTELSYYLVGMVCAMIFGFLAMKFLIYMAKKEKFGFFAYYCILVGILTAVFG